jgi:hypothetical protein
MVVGRRDGMENTERSAKDSDLEKIRPNLEHDPKYRDIMGIYTERSGGDTGRCREIRVRYREKRRKYRVIIDPEWEVQRHLRMILEDPG